VKIESITLTNREITRLKKVFRINGGSCGAGGVGVADRRDLPVGIVDEELARRICGKLPSNRACCNRGNLLEGPLDALDDTPPSSGECGNGVGCRGNGAAEAIRSAGHTWSEVNRVINIRKSILLSIVNKSRIDCIFTESQDHVVLWPEPITPE